MSKRCEDCGSNVYSGACVNCYEEIYIEGQHLEQGTPTPKLIKDTADAQREDIRRKDSLRQIGAW